MGLSFNKNITMEFIEKNMDKQWNWSILSMSPNLTGEFLDKHENENWYFYNLAKNENISIKNIMKFEQRIMNDYSGFKKEAYKNISMNFMNRKFKKMKNIVDHYFD